MFRRIALPEVEDFPSFPAWLREYETDYLRALFAFFKPYDAAIPLLKKAAQRSGTGQIVDLCSGSGGPLPQMKKELNLPITLTDLFPNPQSHDLPIWHKPVDARAIPQELKGFRTMFTGLHHFNFDECREIFKDALKAGEGIAVFEVTERSISGVLLSFLMPLLVLILTPWIKPRSFKRFIFTYLIPLVPLAVWWDGFASHLKSYSVEEMGEMVEDLRAYEWEVGTLRAAFGRRINYVIGTQRAASTASAVTFR
jgi:hypothetical protein